MLLFNYLRNNLRNIQIVLKIDLAGSLARKLLVAVNKFYNNSMKQYDRKFEKNCLNFELCSAILEIIENIFPCLYTPEAPGLDRIPSRFLKDGVALLLYNLVDLLYKIDVRLQNYSPYLRI